MRKALLGCGVAVLCLPLTFVLWLMIAGAWPAMDRITLHLPMSIRETVASVAMQNVGWGKNAQLKLQRVLRLSPDDATAWTRSCEMTAGKSGDRRGGVQTCERAVALDDSGWNFDHLGRAQERAGDECAAEESFTRASSKSSMGYEYGHVESMGRASLRCGDLYSARAGLEAAIDLQEKSYKAPDQDPDDIDGTRADEKTDREYLIVTLDRLHETRLAKETCSQVHPEWGGCVCALDSKGEASCADAKR